MYKGKVSVKVAAAAGSLLLAGCGGAAVEHEEAPAQVRQTMRSNPSAYPRLSSGRFHSLALKADGSVWAWGSNTHKQLGDGTQTNRTQPVQVQGLTGTFVAVATGSYHSMALRNDGTLWSWGENSSGPTQMLDSAMNPVSVLAMAGGNGFSVVLDANGAVWAWGSNGSCQLGNGSHNVATLPGRVQTADSTLPYLTGVVAIAAGPQSAMAIRTDGSVWAWGDNAHGVLGNGSTTDQCKAVKILSDPTPLDTLDNVVPVDMEMGYNHTLLLLSNGTVMAWGNNGFGQLGTGDTVSSLTPRPVSGLCDVTQISAGTYSSLAVSNGVFFSWGYNGYGLLCNNSSAGSSSVPVNAVGGLGISLPSFNYVGAGEYFATTLAADGTLWSCGFDGYGALGYEIPGSASTTKILLQVPAFP